MVAPKVRVQRVAFAVGAAAGINLIPERYTMYRSYTAQLWCLPGVHVSGPVLRCVSNMYEWVGSGIELVYTIQ